MIEEVKELKLDALRAYNKAVSSGYRLEVGNNLESALWMAHDYARRAGSLADDPVFVDKENISSLIKKSREMIDKSIRLMESTAPEFPQDDGRLFYSPFPAIDYPLIVAKS